MAQWVFKHSEEFGNRRHFPLITAICRFFYHTSKIHCAASNSWPIWTQKVLKETQRCGQHTSRRFFFKNILLHMNGMMNGRLSKIRSLHRYVNMHLMFYFERYSNVYLDSLTMTFNTRGILWAPVKSKMDSQMPLLNLNHKLLCCTEECICKLPTFFASCNSFKILKNDNSKQNLDERGRNTEWIEPCFEIRNKI